MAIQSHKDLEVWQKAMNFVTTVYAFTKQFPKEELYGLTSQIRRSAISILSNLAEERSKRSTREFIRFVNIATGSAAELETQIMISQNLGYITANEMKTLQNELNSIARMLNGLHAGLEKRLSPEP